MNQDGWNLSTIIGHRKSRLLKEALEKKLIKPIDSETGQRYMKDIPIWG